MGWRKERREGVELARAFRSPSLPTFSFRARRSFFLELSTDSTPFLFYRYDERNPNSTLEAQEYEEGQTADSVSAALANPTDTSGVGQPGSRGRDQGLWNDDEIEFYENGQGALPGEFRDFTNSTRFGTSERADRTRCWFWVGSVVICADDQAPNKNKWHYPANFEGAGAGPSVRDENRVRLPFASPSFLPLVHPRFNFSLTLPPLLFSLSRFAYV